MSSIPVLPAEYKVLKEMFGKVDENIVRKVYEDYKNHPNVFDACVSELLTITAVQEETKRKEEEAAAAAKPAVQSDAPNAEAFHQVRNMFPDLTRSVIGGALFQNQGQAEAAINLLLDIGQDKEAIAQIRDMNPEKKAQYANDRAKEREQQLAEKAAALQREREEMVAKAEEERKMKELDEKKRAAANEEAAKMRRDLVELMQAKMAAELAAEKAKQQQKEYEAQAEVARKTATEAERHVANAILQKLEEQKERDAQLAREAQEELARRHRQTVERQPEAAGDLLQSIAGLRNAAGRRAVEQLRAQEENDRHNARLKDLEARDLQHKAQIDQVLRDKDALAHCTLSAEYSQREKKLLVSWKLGPERSPTSSDWIGVFSIGATNPSNYLTYISTDTLQASTAECPLPTEPGLYVCIFFYGKAKEPLASSEQIYLGPSLDMTAIADPVRGIISLQYRVKTGNPTKKDWIGFYRSDKPNNKYLEYKWLQPDVLEGIWEVKMPRRGGYDYEFRFFSHTLKLPMQTSNKVSLPKGDYLKFDRKDIHHDGSEFKDTVTWTIVSVDPTSWDWIELINATTKQRITWSYLDMNGQSLSFNVPRTPGHYQYRYWASSIGSGPVAFSPQFEVVNRDRITLEAVDGVILRASIDIHSIVTNTSCWVGIFPEGSEKYQSFQYLPTVGPRAILTFQNPSPGRYEARFFSSSDKYNPIARSEVVQFP